MHPKKSATTFLLGTFLLYEVLPSVKIAENTSNKSLVIKITRYKKPPYPKLGS